VSLTETSSVADAVNAAHLSGNLSDTAIEDTDDLSSTVSTSITNNIELVQSGQSLTSLDCSFLFTTVLRRHLAATHYTTNVQP
jgi:hypothetical protein